jgi:hypothetical protein
VVYNETSKTSHQMDGISSQPEGLAFSVKENSTVDFPATSLMFEVSSNTGRIHLYLLDLDLPKPLGINFRPEDLENLRTGACEKGRSFPTWFVHSITHQDAAMSFWSQWNQLRPVIRKRLSGRPLLLPLSSELSCLKIQSQYTEGGLSKVRSIRRVTPSEEVGCAARPEGALVQQDQSALMIYFVRVIVLLTIFKELVSATFERSYLSWNKGCA